ncbi:MAG: extracellular solute-binding protein [Patescibacteria group bacterium]
MKSLSVFQVILLAVFSALAISGVLVFALFVGSGTGNTIGPIVIWGTQEPGAFTIVLRQASENDSRLGQVSYVQKDPVTYENLLTEALANGTGPDLFLLRQDYSVQNAGKVIPIPYTFLSKTQFEDVFVEAAKPYLTNDGVLGVPILIDPLIMYWNRDILGTAGFAKPPQYLDEFPSLVAKIIKRDDSGRITKAAVAFGEYDNVDHAKDILSLLILQAGGTITRKDNLERLAPALSTRTQGQKIQAGESALRFYAEFADPSKVNYSWNRSLPNSRAAFAAGDLALYFGYASEARIIARINPNLNFAPASMPQGRDRNSINVAHVYALAISRASRNPVGARTVASLIGDTSLARALAIALDIPSARRDVLAERSEDENVLFENQAIIARSWIDPNPEKTSDVFRGMIETVTSGAARYGEAIGKADQQMAQIIGE